MKALASAVCDNCGKRFVAGNTHGMPNGISMIMENGNSITLCQQCLIDVGAMSEPDKSEFYKKILKGKENDI